jgi:type II secretory pathway pseudopilin PulG
MSNRFCQGDRESGFTVTEIMAAAAILTIGILGVLIVFNSTMNTQTTSKVRTLATNIATEKIEMARNVSYANLTQAYLETNAGTYVYRNSINFYIAYAIVFVDDPSDGTGTSDLDPNDFKSVKVTVSWSNPKPASSVAMETLINSNPATPISASTDVTAPVWPNGGAGVLSGRAEQLTPGLGCYIQWSPNWATDANGVVGYLIYRRPPDDSNYLLVATVAPSVGWFLDAYYTAAGTYGYYVKAFDGAGNVSGACNSVSIVGPLDTTAPSTPTNLTGAPTGPTSVRLTWTPSTDNSGAIAYYNMYRTHAGVPFGNTPFATASYPPFDDYGLTTGTSYQYYITAVDPAGNESPSTASVTVTPQ